MKKITFIHISDVLLGALPDRECVWSGERKNEIYMTFEAVVARAGELDVDFFWLQAICLTISHLRKSLHGLMRYLEA